MSLIDLRFNTEMINACQDEKQVTVEILNKETNQKEMLTAQYLIAADGANSSLRKLFNIEMEGVDNLGVFCNIYCEMNLDKYVETSTKRRFYVYQARCARDFYFIKKGSQKVACWGAHRCKPQFNKRIVYG